MLRVGEPKNPIRESSKKVGGGIVLLTSGRRDGLCCRVHEGAS